MRKGIEQITQEDGRYKLDAVRFVYEGLGHTAKTEADKSGSSGDLNKSESGSGPHHISGQELCHGLRHLASEKWGRMAKVVLNHWGVKTTRDFGEIVYMMIRHKWMSAQPDDSIDDFNNVFDFKTVFEDQFELDV
jgi:uncharacterized repeat protein (TIGR04138 family)